MMQDIKVSYDQVVYKENHHFIHTYMLHIICCIYCMYVVERACDWQCRWSAGHLQGRQGHQAMEEML